MNQHEILKFFAKFIQSELGIIYEEHNYFQLQNRLEEIAKTLNIASIDLLCQQAQKGLCAEVKQLLLDSATNNETSFFRDQRIFNVIESTVLPSIVKNNTSGTDFRVWSAASSSGQEALSLAMLINEWNLTAKNKISFSILGTDISDRVLKKAKEASYSQLEIQRGLPPNLQKKYFEKDINERWRASAELKKFVEYKKQNLLDSFNFPYQFNLILCRNVLIYQNVESKIKILNRIFENLAPGGFLVLGSGESLLGLSQNYIQKNIDGAVLYQKKEVQLIAA